MTTTLLRFMTSTYPGYVGFMSDTVTAVRAAAYEIPTDQPEQDGTLDWSSTVIVVVEADAGGRTGIGYTYAHRCVVPLVTSLLADVVTGRDPDDVRATWLAMVLAVRNLGTTGLAAMAISAVDNALWDLKARLHDISLVDLLGAAHDVVPVYGSGGFTSYDDHTLATQLAGWVEQGIPRVKLKIGRHPRDDRHRLDVARKAIGDETSLLADANGAYAVSEAIEWSHILRGEFGVDWFEEPVSSDDLGGLRAVRDRRPGGLDIAAGEYLPNPWAAHAMVAAGAVDCLQLDVTRCLGITGFLQAAGQQIDVSAHCAPQQSVHACAAVPRLRHLEWFHDHVRIESMLFDGVIEPSAGGVLRPRRDRPGNGLTLRRSDAERFRAA
jgi:L-alanine-DL-glutamate epimerase-like enolase superfamily enzyme